MPIVQVVIDDSTDKIITGFYTFDRDNGGTLVIPSGASLPGSPSAKELFWNTTDGILYRRNDGNTAWVAIISAVSPHTLGGSSHTTDTLANLNSKISDATLDDSNDSRDPNAHKTSHQSGGSDSIKLDDLVSPDDNTDLNATTSAHGLLPKLGGGTINFLRADGTWATPPGGTDTLQSVYENGNTINVTSSEGTVLISNDTNSDTTTALEISRSPTSSTSGYGLKVVLGENTTGTACQIENNGSGRTFRVRRGGTTVIEVDDTGSVSLTAVENNHVGLSSSGTGNTEISSADIVDINGGDIEISGDQIRIDAYNADSYINVELHNFTISTEDSGDISINAADELIFRDTGASNLTLSQTGNRTLSATGAGEIFENITSIVGAFNALGPHALGGAAHSLDTLANLNSKISDATLDDSNDSRDPNAHKTSHQSGGSDSIKLDDLVSPDDNTDLNATTSAHGLLPKLGGGSTNFLRADGTWAAPSTSTVFGDDFIYGLSLSRSTTWVGGYPVSTFNIATGMCRSDDDTTNLVVDTTITGISFLTSGAGGLDTGSKGTYVWYYVWLIYNPTSETYNGLLSLSATSPTMPSGYTKKKRVGSMFAPGYDVWLFYQLGSGKLRKYIYSDEDSAHMNLLVGGTATTYTDIDCSDHIPPTSTFGIFIVRYIAPANSQVAFIKLRPNGTTEHDPTVTKQCAGNSGSGKTAASSMLDMATDEDQVIEYCATHSGDGMDCQIWSLGYYENI